MAYLRVSIGGDEDELYSAAPGVALVYFDMNSKMLLLGHETEVAPLSEVYGDIRGGALLHLRGDNFAPLGPDLQCIFDTPMRRDFHQGTGIAEYNGTINATSMPATYLSPQRILCEAPPYQRVGPTTLYVNSSYNTSLFERPEWGVVAQVQPRRRPSPHAPRPLRSPPLTRRPSLSLPQPGRGCARRPCAARRALPPAEASPPPSPRPPPRSASSSLTTTSRGRRRSSCFAARADDGAGAAARGRRRAVGKVCGRHRARRRAPRRVELRTHRLPVVPLRRAVRARHAPRAVALQPCSLPQRDAGPMRGARGVRRRLLGVSVARRPDVLRRLQGVADPAVHDAGDCASRDPEAQHEAVRVRRGV